MNRRMSFLTLAALGLGAVLGWLTAGEHRRACSPARKQHPHRKSRRSAAIPCCRHRNNRFGGRSIA